MENVSKLLLKKGKSFYKKGRPLIVLFWIGFALVVLIPLISFIGYGSSIAIGYLSLCGPIDFVNFLMGVGYLGILAGLIGFPLYFFGLHYMGLGQIAKNTETHIVNDSDLPEL
ncbi:MAG: hypothetical protein ACI4MR_06240 [Candidatus Aphodomorpha sp.]